MSEIQVVANSVTPTPPPAGYLALYAKSDGLWYVQDSAGAETLVGPVTSVAGKVGVVTLVKADVGLGLVDNTSDTSKPVSTAQQAALDLKLNAVLREAVNGVAGLDANLEVIKPQAGAGQEVTAGRPYSVKLADGTWGVGISTGGIGNVNDPLVHIPFRRANDELRLSGTQAFTRASTGTYIDPLDGLVKTAAINTPRFERMADGGIGILLEGASTNNFLHSQDFTQAAWIKANATVVGNATTGPDGLVSADTVSDTTVNGVHRLGQRAVPAGAQTKYAIVHAGTITNVQVRIYNATDGLVALAHFDIANGAVVSTTAGTSKIKSLGNGWYWCEVSGTGTATSYGYVELHNGTSYSYTGTGSGTINIWHAQGENLPFGSSVIPTTTAAVTRAGDNLYFSASGNMGAADANLTVMLDADILWANATSIPSPYPRFFDVGGANFRRLYASATSINGGLNNASISSGFTTDLVAGAANNRLAITIDFINNVEQFYRNGVAGASYTASPQATGTANNIFIGASSGAGQQIFGHIRNFRIYDRALTASEIAAA